MASALNQPGRVSAPKLAFFERYLSLWVALCMLAGVIAGKLFPAAVATATALFGPESGAALATVVGVLVEVPVMLSVCAACNRTRHWFTYGTVG
jgi:ACR3 family arsenite efflux pump ArsB